VQGALKHCIFLLRGYLLLLSINHSAHSQFPSQPNRFEFSFCNYPYVYDPASKARVLQMENQMAQYNELQNALFRYAMYLSCVFSTVCVWIQDSVVLVWTPLFRHTPLLFCNFIK